MPPMLTRAATLILTAGLSFAVFHVSPAQAQATLPTDFTDQLIRGSLNLPTGLAFVPDAGVNAGRRLFYVEQGGVVRLLVDGAPGVVDPSGTVANTVTAGGERGLLGLAVDPRWPTKPYVYFHQSSLLNTIRIVRYTCTGDLAFTNNGALTVNPATRYELISDAPDVSYKHSGGTLRFAPDSTLFVSLGDDGNSCSAQDTTTLSGVILRLEVRNLPDGAGGPPARALLVPAGNPFPNHPSSNARLVWAMGFRNPWRFHVDAGASLPTGRLLVGDVGEESREEIDVIGKANNAGWPMFEGNITFTPCSQAVDSGFTTPIYTYDHSLSGGLSVLTLGIYRRAGLGAGKFPIEYEGDALFSDYFSGWIRRLNWNGSSWVAESAPGQPSATNWATNALQISDALIAPDGAIWYVKQGINYAANTGQVRVIRYTGTLDVPGGSAATIDFAPAQPNPARGSTHFAFTLGAVARAELTVLDLSGRRVRTLVRDALPAGPHDAVWDGRDDTGTPLSAGLYFARLRVGDASRTQRVVLAR